MLITPRSVMGKVYAHINNGGVSFSIEDGGHGPEIVIESSHFGNNKHRQSVMVNRRTLEAIRDVFIGACEEEFSEDYCMVASIPSLQNDQSSVGFPGDDDSDDEMEDDEED